MMIGIPAIIVADLSARRAMTSRNSCQVESMISGSVGSSREENWTYRRRDYSC